MVHSPPLKVTPPPELPKKEASLRTTRMTSSTSYSRPDRLLAEVGHWAAHWPQPVQRERSRPMT